MDDDAAIHVRKELSEALAAEAKRAGVSVNALAEEAIGLAVACWHLLFAGGSMRFGGQGKWQMGLGLECSFPMPAATAARLLRSW